VRTIHLLPEWSDLVNPFVENADGMTAMRKRLIKRIGQKSREYLEWTRALVDGKCTMRFGSASTLNK
jgi:hypothetical protein